MLHGTQRINDLGHLEIGGCDCVDLAARFGTPLWILDEQLLRDNCRQYKKSFSERLGKVEVCYAGKALLTTAMCRIMEQEDLGLDVASAGELFTALQAGFPTSRVKMHGNFKSDLELEMAVDAGVGRIVVDSLSEIGRLSAVAQKAGRTADVLLRVTPGIKVHTHSFMTTGNLDSKFGLGLDSGEAEEAVRQAMAAPGINLLGIHCHIGSQIFGLESFTRATEIMVEFMAAMRHRHNAEMTELDMGGGLGIAYTKEDAPPSISELADVQAAALQRAAETFGLPVPRLILEPGRSIVGAAGITLYTVGPVKEIPGVRTYVSVDGGLSDNPRPGLYDAEYEALVANKADQAAAMVVRVSGKHCETDTLIPEIALQPVEEGDLLAVFCTGAYNYAMASNYNRFPRPAMVLACDGVAEVIVERESLEDLVRQDRVPPRLAR
jgi:diaminopimelate decarboxylase